MVKVSAVLTVKSGLNPLAWLMNWKMDLKLFSDYFYGLAEYQP
jgi:hypothetical protein